MSFNISHDRPLIKADALKHDKLSRSAFATTAVKALRHVTEQSGFVLSIEGEWGSGKTSVLALMEALLADRTVFLKEPIVVQFNPWLVGERDALLRQFLSAIASKLEVADNAGVGQRIAKELKTYGKLFEVLKLIPGAEPWVSLVKSTGDAFSAVSDATGAISEYKTPDLEARRAKVAEALSGFDRPIVVFIDDIDRLFPAEVFEMVRIIKAVGDLPNVGYVLAWDSAYVGEALRAANVPQSATYLDKIVQVRLPLPKLSISAKGRLVDEAIEALDPEARKWHFKDDEQRLSSLYFSGLREVLDQPRDIMRVFNTVSLLEPGLRGEISLADIVGLAALKVKAPEVFELIGKSPQYFVGRLPSDISIHEKSDELVAQGAKERKTALLACAVPDAARRVLHFLFPLIAEADKRYSMDRVEAAEGHIASPARLFVAMQHCISPLDVSLVAARRYLVDPTARMAVAASLTPDNCLDFLGAIADVARITKGVGISDPQSLCITLAQLIETDPFLQASDRGGFMFTMRPLGLCRSTISTVIDVTQEVDEEAVWSAIVKDPLALSLALDVLRSRFSAALTERKDSGGDLSGHSVLDEIDAYAANILHAAREGRVFASIRSGSLLWTLAQWKPSICSAVREALEANDLHLDQFIQAFLSEGRDTYKGQIFAWPDDVQCLEAFISIDTLRDRARKRLEDGHLIYPSKAAWRVVLEGGKLYAVDGSEVD